LEQDNYLKELQERNEALMNDLYNIKSKPKGKVGYVFLLTGIILFAFSIDYSSSLLAILSLATLLWGGLFLYIRPSNFTRTDIFLSNLNDSYALYNQILNDIKHEGKIHYASRKSLSEINDVYIFIPKNRDKFLFYEDINWDGSTDNYIQIYPIGLGLAKLIEEEARINLAITDIKKLSRILEKVLIMDLEIVKQFEMVHDDSKINIKLSLYDKYNDLNKIVSKKYDLNYIISAIACSLAMALNQPLVIEKVDVDKNGLNIAELSILNSDITES
jgi:hypothetical protein